LLEQSFYLFLVTTIQQSRIAMTLLAIIMPWLSFMLRGKILTGILCLILQITIVGWIPAAIWAVVSLQNRRADKRTDRIVNAMKSKAA